jgi:hypothetical protein
MNFLTPRLNISVEIEKRILRRIVGTKRQEVTRHWRGLHNEKLRNLYFLPNIIRVIK